MAHLKFHWVRHGGNHNRRYATTWPYSLAVHGLGDEHDHWQAIAICWDERILNLECAGPAEAMAAAEKAAQDHHDGQKGPATV